MFKCSMCVYPTFCGPVDCSLPGSSVHGIFWARILKRVAISYSRVSSWSSVIAVVVLFNFISKMSQICYRPLGASLVVQMVKNLPAMQVTQVRSLGWDDPLERKVATHPSILAGIIPWTEEPGRLSSVGSQRVRHN